MLCVSRKQFLLTPFSNIILDDNNVWLRLSLHTYYIAYISRSFVKFQHIYFRFRGNGLNFENQKMKKNKKNVKNLYEKQNEFRFAIEETF